MRVCLSNRMKLDTNDLMNMQVPQQSPRHMFSHPTSQTMSVCLAVFLIVHASSFVTNGLGTTL